MIPDDMLGPERWAKGELAHLGPSPSPERLQAIGAELVQEFKRRLSQNRADCLDVFSGLSPCLQWVGIRDMLWEWVVEVGRKAGEEGDIHVQCALKCATLELLTEGEYSEYWINRLIELLGCRDTVWMVLAAYEHDPEKMHSDFTTWETFRAVTNHPNKFGVESH